MKKLIIRGLAIGLLLSPALAQAKRHHRKAEELSGEVIAAQTTTITISGKKTKTISVPSGTPINGMGRQESSSLNALIGKRVKVTEKAPGIAKEISVEGAKKPKSSSSKVA